MKKRKLIVFLSAAVAGALVVKIAKKKKTKFVHIRADNDEILDIEDTDISVEYDEDDTVVTNDKEEALERIMSDVEEMYRDREEVVPIIFEESEESNGFSDSLEEIKEEVLVPAKTERHKRRNGVGNVIKKLSIVILTASVLTGSTRGFTITTDDTVITDEIEADHADLIEEDEMVDVIAEAPEPEETEIYEELPALIAKQTEPALEPEEATEQEQEQYSADDVYLLAQLIVNESGNQKKDGQIGVAEVVVNRLNSNKYPDTLEEVIYQPGQFSNNKAIETRTPSEEVVTIAEDVLNNGLRIFDNEDVLYFRNPMITSGISAEDPIDWGRCPYYGHIGDHAFYLKAGSKAMDEKTIRLKIQETAIAYGDKVKSYKFGGKPNAAGDDNTNLNLDCSGYVSWVLGEALEKKDVSPSNMGSANVNKAFGLTEVSKDQLNVGDIGYRYEPGTIKPVNHCGIYMGNGEWIHCNSGDNGVVLESTDMFKHFYSAV